MSNGMLGCSSTDISALVPIATLGAICACIAYQWLFHPLAAVPGPRIAALTNAWKAYHIYHLHLHEVLAQLHAQHGPVVRIGPNAVHVQDAEAVAKIYKGGRSFPKTHFYSAFQTFNHNLFGTQDDDLHSLRRRQMAHGLSQKSIETMEDILDAQLVILSNRLSTLAKTGEVFDLKDYLSRYVLDILGEVAFGCSFNMQGADESEFEAVPTAIRGHLLLACIIGELPFQTLSKKLLAYSPIGWMRSLVKSRQLLKETCAKCVRARIEEAGGDRKDILQSLIKARDPETGASLTEIDINTEAFAMLVAGSHTTSGTLGLFFAHLLLSPDFKKKLEDELKSRLGPPGQGRQTHRINGLEDSLPFLMACVRENFRMDPVFSMLLWRRVTSPAGLVVGESVIPKGTDVSGSNFVQHHDPSVWGDDCDVYDPDRWIDGRTKGLSANLIPFSTGHRMCIGRNLAMTNILKTVTTLMTRFEIVLVRSRAGSQPVRLESCGIGEMEGKLWCVVTERRP